MVQTLFQDDLVSHGGVQGVVQRTYGNPDSHDPHPAAVLGPDQLARHTGVDPAAFVEFLSTGVPPKGTVLVEWARHGSPAFEIIHESKLTLVDRTLLIGDIVKRDERDTISGVVVNAYTTCTLLPIQNVKYKGISLQGHRPPMLEERGGDLTTSDDSPAPLLDVPLRELKRVSALAKDDLVVYHDWVGRVEETQDIITIRLSDNCVVEIHEYSLDCADGLNNRFCVGDIAYTKKGILRREGRYLYGQYNANTPAAGTVVDVVPSAVDVSWLQRRISSRLSLEPHPTLERQDLESDHFAVYDRLRRPLVPSGSVTVSDDEWVLSIGDRVRFRDLSGACVKYPGLRRIDRRDSLGYDMNIFQVQACRSEVSVQWQDLTITREPSVGLVPDSELDDEHAAWPGGIAHTLDTKPVENMPGVVAPSKVGVIQSVNAAERMARIRWCPTACAQYSTDIGEDPQNRIFVSSTVGVATGDVQEVSLYDIETPSAMNVERGDIALIVTKRWKDSGEDGDSRDRDWLGEVIDTRLDGTLLLRLHAAAEVRDVVVNREDCVVLVRSDGSDLSDGFDDPMDDVVNPENPLGPAIILFPERFRERDEDEDADYWDDEDGSEQEEEEEEEFGAMYEDENGDPMDEDEVQDSDWESEVEGETSHMDVSAAEETPPTSNSSTPQLAEAQRRGDEPENALDTPEPAAYDVYDSSVPTDHFYATTQPSSNSILLKRIAREHKILRSPDNLPSGVYIRTWESRLDLLRALIIGPSETPYAGAPFVIDFHMPPDYPSQPPKLFFHSWSSESGLGGVGRVNPNLYEDGKICLSLLGTWDGEKGESWNAGKSTLLQVIVSLLGLVLVKEPYFNEAGYEPLSGLETSKRPSALYNERTYLRSRAFILVALKSMADEKSTKAPGLAGMEDIIKWQYTLPQGPRLIDKAVAHGEAILERSEGGNADPDGANVLSKGACIPLRRVKDRLKQFQ